MFEEIFVMGYNPDTDHSRVSQAAASKFSRRVSQRGISDMLSYFFVLVTNIFMFRLID